MERSATDRIMGIETEFGCLVDDPEIGTPEAAVEAIKNHIFYEMRLGAIDQHARDDVFEPARSGGFLLNGGRLYIDAVGSHLEYATAECRTIKDLIAHDRAGHRIIQRAINELGWQNRVRIYNNSIDHFGGHTFGCHENFLSRIDDEFFGHRAHLLFPFLVTRQIFAGAGRVGGHILTHTGHQPTYEEMAENPIDYIWVSNVYQVLEDPTVKFQLSQRADHLLKTIAGRVRFNRALINPKWEQFYSSEELQRLHLLFGESNQNEIAFALKIGTTSLAIKLIEDHLLPNSIILANPIAALQDISRDENFEWLVVTAQGEVVSAIEIQRRYLELAERYRGQDAQTDWVLDEWRSVLNGLEADPMQEGERVDWVAKRKMIELFMSETDTEWGSGVLHSLDMEYHNIDPTASLYHGIAQEGGARRVVTEADIIDAMTDAPPNTRAFGRSKMVEQVLADRKLRHYAFDWNMVVLGRGQYYDLSNPYHNYADLQADTDRIL